MKLMTKTILAATFALAGTTLCETALAYRTSVGVGFSFGFPGYWYGPGPAYYPPAYPYPYYPAYYPAAPTSYVEQGGGPQVPAQPLDQSWYYCDAANAYYPYVRECAGGWQRVAPTPPGPVGR